MDRLDVFLVLLGLLLLVSPETLNLRLELLFALPEVADLGVEILDLTRKSLHLVPLFLQLGLEGFLVFSESTLQRCNFIFKILDLTRMHLLTLIVFNLLCAHLVELFLPFFVLLNAELEGLTLDQELL